MKATSGNKVQVRANIMISEVSPKYKTNRNFLQKGLLSAQLEGPLSLKAIILGSMWRLEIIREELFIDKETPRERIV